MSSRSPGTLWTWSGARPGSPPRRFPGKTIAKKYKGSRWALCKDPADLTEKQAATLAGLRKQRGALWRAYQLKEALRAVFADDLDPDTVIDLIRRWCSQRSRLPSFVKAARTIRKHADGIAAAVTRGPANARHEGLNKARTMAKRAYGFHTPEAALALIMLACGPVKLQRPYHA